MVIKPIPEEISEYLSYNPDTGDLTWIKSTSNRNKVGNTITCTDSKGYLLVGFMRKLYLVHRVAWLLHTGEQPPEFIDHVDGNKSNNTFTNLREATHSENRCNQGKRIDNTSGYKGVYWNKRGRKWYSQIVVSGCCKNLGTFNTPEEAYSAYCKAADTVHKEFKNYG